MLSRTCIPMLSRKVKSMTRAELLQLPPDDHRAGGGTDPGPQEPLGGVPSRCERRPSHRPHVRQAVRPHRAGVAEGRDRKSTRLNSSHVKISYAVFCLKKKKNT